MKLSDIEINWTKHTHDGLVCKPDDKLSLRGDKEYYFGKLGCTVKNKTLEQYLHKMNVVLKNDPEGICLTINGPRRQNEFYDEYNDLISAFDGAKKDIINHIQAIEKRKDKASNLKTKISDTIHYVEVFSQLDKFIENPHKGMLAYVIEEESYYSYVNKTEGWVKIFLTT